MKEFLESLLPSRKKVLERWIDTADDNEYEPANKNCHTKTVNKIINYIFLFISHINCNKN